MSTASSKKLWQVGEGLHPQVESFTVGDDYIYDATLLPYDIQASIAHAKMLFSIGVLSKTEAEQAEKGLEEIIKLYHTGNFHITQNQEDGHTAIEQYLTEHFGEIGKKIHTGRSRNDQSLVMIRLYTKASLKIASEKLSDLITAFSAKAEESKETPMPGYTHMQKAMPTKVGVWLLSFTAGFKDVKTFIDASANIIDQNPLGSAAGFGIENLKLDRDLTSKLLGFAKTQENPLYCGLSRGYFESIALSALSAGQILYSRFASDMMLFTMQEMNYVSLPSQFVTGSSIMPQKKNYDVFEIMRAKVRVFLSLQAEIQGIIAGLGSGYHRDLQLTKKPFIDAVNIFLETTEVLLSLIPHLEFHSQTLKNAMTEDLFLTEKVYEKVAKGKPFRDAYLETKEAFFKKHS